VNQPGYYGNGAFNELLPPARQSGIRLKGDTDEIIEQLLQAIKSYI